MRLLSHSLHTQKKYFFKRQIWLTLSPHQYQLLDLQVLQKKCQCHIMDSTWQIRVISPLFLFQQSTLIQLHTHSPYRKCTTADPVMNSFLLSSRFNYLIASVVSQNFFYGFLCYLMFSYITFVIYDFSFYCSVISSKLYILALYWNVLCLIHSQSTRKISEPEFFSPFPVTHSCVL